MEENMKRCELVEMVSENCSKKRKLENDCIESPESSMVKKSLRLTDPENVDDDLKVKDCETKISMSIDVFSSELSGEESDSSSTSFKKKSSSKPIRKTTMMPSEEELEEFFAAEEKHQHKRFSEKYNFDVVKDVPLEGKYQWVRLHP